MQDEMYCLCYEHQLSSDLEPRYILIDFETDMNAFQTEVEKLRALQKNADRIKYVEMAYQGFLDLKETMREYTRIGQIKLEIATRSFFVEFDIFLKHWEKCINSNTRREELYKLYQQLTHDAYDSSDDYAMATIIRNYAVHFAGIINGTIWGNTYYEVSVWKRELLGDDRISQNKKEVIRRQTSEFIMLSSIMKGALEKLKEVQNALITAIIDEDIREASVTVAKVIKKIKEYGDRRWFFTDDDGSISTVNEEGRSIRTIQGKCLEMFNWKEFDELIATI